MSLSTQGLVARRMHICLPLRLSSLDACILALLAIWCSPLAHAGDLTSCISRKMVFDGIARLQYATVKATAGPHVSLHSRYPKDCRSGNQTLCLSRAYLVSGDAVAVGKECGRWSYVQYIGQKRISEGWLASRALRPNAPPLPGKPPIFRVGREVFPAPTPRRYRFQLVKGRTEPVCEAYLQRLNQSEFYRPPYCGRPESTLVPGFSFLHRTFLSIGEYKGLFFEANAVLSGEPSHHNYVLHRNPDGSTSYVAPYNPIYAGFTPGAWTYNPPVNIENSGTSDNVIIWTVEDRYRPSCGTESEPDGGLARGSLYGLVSSRDLSRIDRRKTYQVFGIPDVVAHPPPTATEFGRDFGIFEYRKQAYFDTVFDKDLGDAAGHRGQEPSLSRTLGVFLYRQGRRYEVCEYHISNRSLHP